MTENVESAMFEILKRIQVDVGDVKGRLERVETRLGHVETRLERVETRLERMEVAAKRQRREGAAMLVMMRGAAGIFDERLEAIEDDVRALKERVR